MKLKSTKSAVIYSTAAAIGVTGLARLAYSEDTPSLQVAVTNSPIDDGSSVTAPDYNLAKKDATTPPSGHFFPTVSSTLPYDVNMTPAGKSTFQTQQLFDIFSWQTFIALNWPAYTSDAEYGKPLDVQLGSSPASPRVWETFIEPYLVFKDKGATPDPYNPWENNNIGPVTKSLSAIGKRHHLLDEVDESPFPDGSTPMPPIIDLNGEYVRFEIRLNETEYDYICNKKLYTTEGQKAFIDGGGKIRFPLNQGTSKHGSIEIKAAWKKMGIGDDRSKFYTQKVDVKEPFAPGQPTVKDQLYGLVGMHIMTRVGEAEEWVWATFEHVDNAPTADLTKSDPRLPSTGKFSFYDPSYDSTGKQSLGGFNPDAKPDNKESGNYYEEKNKRKPTQISRVVTQNNAIILSKWTESINSKMQTQLAGTVWENYRLVSTQWPSDTGKGSAGDPAPITLGNAVFETYMQVNASCMSCHAKAALAEGTVSSGNDYANFSFMLQRAQSAKKTN